MKKKVVLKVYLDPEKDADILGGLVKFRKPRRGEFVRQAIRAALEGKAQFFAVPPVRRAEAINVTPQPQVSLDDVFG